LGDSELAEESPLTCLMGEVLLTQCECNKGQYSHLAILKVIIFKAQGDTEPHQALAYPPPR